MSEGKVIKMLISSHTSLKTSSPALVDNMLGVLSHHIPLLQQSTQPSASKIQFNSLSIRLGIDIVHDGI